MNGGVFDFMAPKREIPFRQRDVHVGDGFILRIFTEIQDPDDRCIWSVGPVEEPHWSETWIPVARMEDFAEMLLEEAAVRREWTERAPSGPPAPDGVFDFIAFGHVYSRMRELPIGEGTVIRLYVAMRDRKDAVAWSRGPADGHHWGQRWILAEAMEGFGEALLEEKRNRETWLEEEKARKRGVQ